MTALPAPRRERYHGRVPRPRPALAFFFTLALGCGTGLACGPSTRDADCARVREILDPKPTPPRRTYDYAAPAPAEAPPFERLRQATWTDDEVRTAVKAAVDEAGPILSYSPYRAASDPPRAIDHLAGLCGIPRLVVDK